MHKDLTGKVYGELTVMSLAGKEKDGHKKWHCKCKCGNEKDIREYSLVHGITTSCGKHKKSTSRLYEIYNGMKKRCYNPKFKFYKHYGGRGITICDSWLEDVINFYNDMEEFYLAHVEKYGEKDTTLDRIDVNKGYSKENCRWATWKEQANNRRNNHIIEYNGVSKTMTEWREELGINQKTFEERVYNGNMSIEEILSKEKHNGKTELRKECDRLGLNHGTVYSRIKRGWTKEKALNTPIMK